MSSPEPSESVQSLTVIYKQAKSFSRRLSTATQCSDKIMHHDPAEKTRAPSVRRSIRATLRKTYIIDHFLIKSKCADYSCYFKKICHDCSTLHTAYTLQNALCSLHEFVKQVDQPSCDTTYMLFITRGWEPSINSHLSMTEHYIFSIFGQLFQVCVFSFFSASLMITTMCLLTKREIISFLVTPILKCDFRIDLRTHTIQQPWQLVLKQL